MGSKEAFGARWERGPGEAAARLRASTRGVVASHPTHNPSEEWDGGKVRALAVVWGLKVRLWVRATSGSNG